MAVWGSRIACVVVTYNRKELLLECLDRLIAQRDRLILRAQETGASDADELDILVIDNGSDDGTDEALAPLADEGLIEHHPMGRNLGGAGGFNAGMRIAVQEGYDYVWVMDDDCLIEEGSLDALLAADAKLDGAYGYLSSVARWTDGEICAMNVQRHPLTRDISDFSLELQPCTLASFVSLWVPAHVIFDVGLPISDFFIWTDDWEFTRRISRRYPCYVVGTSLVTHASATNDPGTIITDSPDRFDRYRLVYRNDLVLYRGEGLSGWAYVLGRGLYHLASVLLRAPDHRWQRAGIIVSSNLAGLRFHPSIEYLSDADFICDDEGSGEEPRDEQPDRTVLP